VNTRKSPTSERSKKSKGRGDPRSVPPGKNNWDKEGREGDLGVGKRGKGAAANPHKGRIAGTGYRKKKEHITVSAQKPVAEPNKL